MTSLRYRVETVSASSVRGTKLQAAAEELANLVDPLLADGWRPCGGVAVAVTPVAKEVVLLQALERPARSSQEENL